MAGGSWEPGVDKIRAGIYTNFVQQAINQVSGGDQGVVAIALVTHGGLAQADTIYEFEAINGLAEVRTTLGLTGAKAVELAFGGGASKVIAYTMPSVIEGEAIDTGKAFKALSTRRFNAFVFSGPVGESALTEAKAWQASNRTEMGRHFFGVYGGSKEDDKTPALGNTRSALVKDLYSINLIVGGYIGDTEYSSAEYTPYIAGMVVGGPLNQGITYSSTNLNAVNVRLTPSETETALKAGSLVLTDNEDGAIVIERAITTNVGDLTTGSNKIRKVRTNMTIVSDVTLTANANWIGKINNNPDGQASVIAGIKAYLDQLASSEVIHPEPVEVTLDPNYASIDDKIYLAIRYIEVDSAEEIYLTIKAGN